MEGQEYTFTLNVSEPASGLWGSASITLVSNHSPYGGFCTLSPDDSLYFLETVVSYSCSGTVISLLLLFHTQVMALRTDVFLAIFFSSMAGWMDDDGDSAQLIFSLQVAQCEDFGPLCPLITLYRGTQSTFSSLVPLGIKNTVENASVIHVLVHIEDSMGATVVAVKKLVICYAYIHSQTKFN